MPLFVITGCYTASGAKGMIDNPSDREAASRAIIEAAGGKLHAFYITTGDTDWLAIVEMNDGADMIPTVLVTTASGGVSNVKTVRAYTGEEFMAAQKKAAGIRSAFKAPAG
jgi:uncharacterized protein with GYD domain